MRSTTSTQTAEAPPSVRPPRHVAIIMDGNNRWAKKRGLPRGAGHKAGVESVRRVLEACAEQGVEVLTLFAFSSENWRRPQAEVSTLMSLLLNALKREVKRLNKNNIRLRVIGNRDRFSETIQKHMAEAEKLTANNSQFTVVIAADYGGQWDITQATQKIASMVVSGELQLSEINAEMIQSKIAIGDLPAPDLCIRTGGEQRISNFLLWQMAYTELYFTDILWPDFDKDEFLKALQDYRSRDRRFGRTSDTDTATC
ncbi:MAG: di-trans,poly-cis-decaprenylcistransferase [Pseudomonadales bacterium]|nr:di-trans,poly-cis-decaprenylcistransferase [Pseudomonadales bacterium]MCP5214220.1 di-trans,poly-cis-decaprenylcistransferase [Pseudomonadales bacterium]